MSINMLEACRTCLRLIDVDNLPFVEIEADGVQSSTESCRYKLLSLIPEMALNITPKSLICVECHGSLEALFEFKEKCLETEKIITRYFRAKPNVDLTNVDLTDVLSFNTSNVTDDETVKAFIEDFAVKEEEFKVDESITVVKHEVDVCLSERSEVALNKEPEIYLSEGFELELNKEPEIRCKVCSKSFEQKCEWQKHMLIHTKKWPYKCVVLLKRLNHAKVRSQNEKYKCQVCNRVFSTNQHLDNHVLVHSAVGDFACGYCPKRFTQRRLLTTHIAFHVRPYGCDICDKRFGNRTILKSHVRTHTGERPYACNVCGKTFSYKNYLKVHVRSHTGERPYVCSVCGMGFRSKCGMNRHKLQRHTDGRPHTCDVCEKSFSTKDYLKAHARVHAKEPQQCDTCLKMFKTPKCLARHVMDMHKDFDINKH